MQLWMLDIPRWCWCITCWSSFSIQNVFLSQFCFFRCFFLVVPNTWSINHQMGSEDRGFWPWRPPWRSLWTTSSLPGAWTSSVRRYFFISGQRAFLLRLAERAASSGSQKGDVYSFAIILYEIHGRSWTLFILERNIHHMSNFQNNRFEEVFHKGWVLLMVVVV